MREYRRSARIKANLLLIASIAALALVSRHWPPWLVVVAFVPLGVGILLYGHFVASQHCPRCRESYTDIRNDFARHYFYIYLPLTAPSRCPKCGECARW